MICNKLNENVTLCSLLISLPTWFSTSDWHCQVFRLDRFFSKAILMNIFMRLRWWGSLTVVGAATGCFHTLCPSNVRPLVMLLAALSHGRQSVLFHQGLSTVKRGASRWCGGDG